MHASHLQMHIASSKPIEACYEHSKVIDNIQYLGRLITRINGIGARSHHESQVTVAFANLRHRWRCYVICLSIKGKICNPMARGVLFMMARPGLSALHMLGGCIC